MGKQSYGQKKNLSWVYRKKVKLGKIDNSETNTNSNVNTDNNNTRIIVRNLSFKVTEKDVREFYASYGEIKEINLLKRPDGNLVGCGFIQFKRVEDASKAIFNTNKKEFLGRTINADWAIAKSKFCKKLEESLSEDKKSDENKGHSSQEKDIQRKSNRNSDDLRKENILKKQKQRKLQKLRKQKKRARIVIRNLSFKITEDVLREHFSKYGEIEEMKILSRPDGKQTGCAFVQFNRVQSAAKAIHYANMQTLVDRAIVVDWAVPKSQFSKNNTDEHNIKPEIKVEPIDEDEVQDISAEVSFDNEDKSKDSDAKSNSGQIIMQNREMKDEFDEDEAETKHEIEDIDCEDGDGSNSNSDDDNDNDEDGSDDNDNNDESDSVIDQSIKEEKDNKEKVMSIRTQRISNDVSEGKTVFLKNLPFSVNNDELKRYMEQFGPVYYALVCIDQLTEHSRGTAFVKFKNVADAEKCLLAGTELSMHDQIIEAYTALHRNEVENKKNLKEQRIKDSRNLYLVKEGVVIAKSPAASEVSVSDMEKRLKLEQWKSQILRNLNMFVSRVRLVVHNLPTDLDNVKLRQLFKNHGGPKSVITEARVMRDLKNIDATGTGRSKEYGFVTFTKHEDALKALRSLNNNPNIFSKNKRPIVGFSIENRIMVNAKEKRIQKNRERNFVGSENKGKRKNEDAKGVEVSTKRVKVRKSDDLNEKPYIGVIGKLGQDKLRSNFNLKSQAEIHTRAVRKKKKLSQSIRQSKIIKKQKIKEKQENKQMQQKKKSLACADDANFNKLVNNYRNKLKDINLKKSKWYESSNKS